MKDMIILEKAREKKMLSESTANTTVSAEVAWVLSPINFAGRYNWTISNTDLDTAKELGLISIKKYWRYASKVAIELDWLHDWILALATFIKYSRRVYNNKKVHQNMIVRQNIDPE